MYLVVCCAIAAGQEQALDSFLAERARPFWLTQPGVKDMQICGDLMVGWSDRTIILQVDDCANDQYFLGTPERKRMNREFRQYTTRVQTQLLAVLDSLFVPGICS